MFTLFDNEFGTMKLDFGLMGRVCIHYEPRASSISSVRYLLRQQECILDFLRAAGFKRVNLFFSHNEIVERLCRKFGFRVLFRLKLWTVMEVDNATSSFS